MIHIATKEIGWSEESYRNILEKAFGVATAAALTNPQLRAVIEYARRQGWKPKGRFSAQEDQLEAFRYRIERIATMIDNGEIRLRGLCRKICQVDDPAWCEDVTKLRRLLAAIGNIYRLEIER